METYADGKVVTPRRQQKASLLGELVMEYFRNDERLTAIDFGCADGAVPVTLLNSPVGERFEHITGITLLNYNDFALKHAHKHPRFTRLVTDLEEPLDHLDLPWGTFDLVTATSMLHYLHHPEIVFRHAGRLLRPGGLFLITIPARRVLQIRRRGLGGFIRQRRNIVQCLTMDQWKAHALQGGLHEIRRQAYQWFGQDWSDPIERFLQQLRLPAEFGISNLGIYRRAEPSAGA